MINIKKGDRVILIKSDSDPNERIPVWGSKYGCVGTSTESDRNIARIHWDNGYQTSFFIHKLQPHNSALESEDPNLAFLLKKTRGRHG